ncbi:uncharacterized protein LOC121379393 [Gigantopelta aegis]|uniref:uncharacterized protein LOC121379393 n=1 Tax=Gigantopelta aegis TaxID=1735272 RepID=UPI001B88A8C6|nr:uncharacterized protein LOC121379393 [Gigantopelta aegis]
MDARACFGFLLPLVLWISLLVEKGLAIRCFMCNSNLHGSDCSDLMSLDEERRNMYNQECDFLEGNRSYTRCRKMVQEYEEETRIIRQCATQGDDGCIQRTGTYKVKFLYCQCSEPLCNSSGRSQPFLIVAVFSVLLCVFIPSLKDYLFGF